MGVFGRLFAESMENVRPEPVWALAATGAPGIAVASYAVFPLAFPPMLIQMLFRFEWNVRAAYIELMGADEAVSRPDEAACALIPEAVTFFQAAALPCAALTGVEMIEEAVRPQNGDTVLVTGATAAS